MAVTKLSDIIVPTIFTTAVEGAVFDQSIFRQTGVIVQKPAFDTIAKTAGLYATLPFWAPIPWAEANSSTDDNTILATARKVNQSAMTFRLFQRNVSFSAMDILNEATGDPTVYAVNSFARLWALEEEYLLIEMIKGLLLRNIASDGSDMYKTVSRTTGVVDATNQLTPATLASLLGTFGDSSNIVDTIVMHGDVYNGLRARDANLFVPSSLTGFKIETYCGYKVVVSDHCTKDVTVPAYPVYSSYLVGPGMFAAGVGASSTAVERSEAAGNGSGLETVYSRRNFILHPQGHAVAATAPANGVTFTNSELATATHWSRVMDRKSVPLAIIKTNA